MPNTAAVPARVSFVTLAVSDMPAMTRFYRQFGWPESKFSDESFVGFQTSGAVLGLFAATNYEAEFGAPPALDAFKGFVLAMNLEDAERVDAAYAVMKRFEGLRVVGEPKDLSFGGRGFEFLDPEGERLGGRLGRGHVLRRARRSHLSINSFFRSI